MRKIVYVEARKTNTIWSKYSILLWPFKHNKVWFVVMGTIHSHGASSLNTGRSV